MNSVLDLIPEKTYDQDALTIEEIAQAKGLSTSHARHHAALWVKEGRAERVFKRVNGKTVPAYRLKR
jgi:hypothetical protein